ncbi:ribonuclease H1 small subunit [Periconia macrospinosa]|uniref:Ribonuclease H1 small subunit n=1 Tax=Periconia macrospinosa TaxID=97972 RepID=A0A2V1D461_9PLEO|nr:ribonuclease H1 small subunit [Periconia macrospinosa]
MTFMHPSSPKKHTANLLPLRINHTGRINNTNEYFVPVAKPNPTSTTTTASSSATPQQTTQEPAEPQPQTEHDAKGDDVEQTKHAYFRGRHLVSTTLPLPSNYTGAVVQFTSTPHISSSSNNPSHPSADEEDEDAEMEGLETTKAHILGTFDEVLIWGHAEKVDEDKDGFVRGVREWVGFAEGLHGED